MFERIEKLEDGLRPFAKALSETGFSDSVTWKDKDGLAIQFEGTDITVGDLRRAAKLVEADKPPSTIEARRE